MKLILPERFRDKITTKISLSGALDTLVDTFSEWLTNNKTEFFPEYTDHGIDHVQSVLNTADEIISEESWAIITPEDIYVLTSSVLLHDCAMHISKEGLWDLITNDLYNGVLLGFDSEEEWSSRWGAFCSEVSRFDESDYTKFFGEYRDVDLPEVGCKSLEDNQKIIIGDFVRRYHACISQVISTYGIPSSNGAIEVFKSDFNYLNQLSGFIARSHNHSLRHVVDLLGDERKREHRNTHPTYLMGVLRVADYLQLKSDRTPKILFNTIGFCSPISINEWKKHLSIISTNDYHPDDELLFIEAFPEDANTLVGIKNLLKGLQKELDEYWAVNGEVYSRYQPLDKLKLNYRRVKSNIDDSIKYVESNHKTYYPEVLSVKSDNQRLFPLLIKPLYGDLPQVGVRELLQNSLDATNERYGQEIKGNVNELAIPYEINITIDFDNNTFELSDSGVGMDVEVIKDYFLKIGSSYRTSEQWKSTYNFEGTTRIPRTGKFGIGMLAGFLIGDKIEIFTRHMDNDSRSIHFEYTLDSNEIELKYKRKSEVGTVITVHSDEKRLKLVEKTLGTDFNKYPQYYREHENELSSWWYFLDSPKVNVLVKNNSDCNVINPIYVIKKNELFKNWNKVDTSTLDGFYWRYNNEKNHVYCNGIELQKMKSPRIKIQTGFDEVVFKNIEICLFDNGGIFPLNLTRDALVINDFYEIEKLKSSVDNEYISKYINMASKYIYFKSFIVNFARLFVADELWHMSFVPFIFNPEKMFPFGGTEHIKESKYVYIDFIYANQNRGLIYNPEFDKIKHEFNYSCFTNSEKTVGTIERAINHLLLNRGKDQGWNFESEDVSKTNQNISSWLYIKKFDFDKLQDSRVGFLESRGLTITNHADWVVISKNEDSDDTPDLGNKIISIKDKKVFMFSLYKAIELTSTEFSNLWEDKLPLLKID
jgi:hypothetical protein